MTTTYDSQTDDYRVYCAQCALVARLDASSYRNGANPRLVLVGLPGPESYQWVKDRFLWR